LIINPAFFMPRKKAPVNNSEKEFFHDYTLIFTCQILGSFEVRSKIVRMWFEDGSNANESTSNDFLITNESSLNE
jgi:hypothetical protein